jgi:3-hydroxybutyryl-CoA dehydrogenase
MTRPLDPVEPERSPPSVVSVLGAGVLGHAIAQDLAAHGARIQLYDVSASALKVAQDRMRSSAQTLVDLGAWTDEQAAASVRCQLTTDLARAVGDATMVIEAAPEERSLKVALWGQVERLCPRDALLASNSSTYTAAELAGALVEPGRLLNAHFFNPAQLMPVVEICAAVTTPSETLRALEELLRAHGKVPVALARPVEGFVANRLQAAMLREAAHLVAQGVVTAGQLDTIVTGTIGRRLGYMGIFRTADLGGLDIFAALADRLFPTLGGDQEAPALLTGLVATGRLGVKTGSGVYDYPGDEGAAWREGLLTHLALGA